MTNPVPDAQSAPVTRGRRSPALARELAASRETEEYEPGIVHTVPQVGDPEESIRDIEEVDSDVYAVVDDLVVIKVTHELPQMNGHNSWYTAGMTSRLDPGETPAEGLQRVQSAVSDHLMETINADWPVVSDLHTQVSEEIVRRERARPIRPHN